LEPNCSFGNVEVGAAAGNNMSEVIGLDHIYIAVADLARSETFYDRLMPLLGFRKNTFAIGGEPHVQYYNRHFGFVLRPARLRSGHDPYAPGLHHVCLRVESIADVATIARDAQAAGIAASDAAHYPDYASDYWAAFFTDPDGIRLEVTNYRQERRERHDRW
jgi:glyoxylase I family protein